jgi:hypothetical protein
MEQELKQYLDSKFANVDQKFADVNVKFAAIDDKFAELEKKLGETEARLRANTEKVETNLLTAFHSWARTYEIQARGLNYTVASFGERLGLVEERLAEVERRTHPRVS